MEFEKINPETADITVTNNTSLNTEALVGILPDNGLPKDAINPVTVITPNGFVAHCYSTESTDTGTSKHDESVNPRVTLGRIGYTASDIGAENTSTYIVGEDGIVNDLKIITSDIVASA